MSNPQIPSSTPQQPQITTQKSAPVPAAETAVVVKATVLDAPEILRTPEKPLRIEGHVISSDAQKGEMHIITAKGEITVQTDVELPPDTEVVVDLYVQKAQTLANIALVQKQDEAAKALLEAVNAKTPPPLKEGDKIIALKLPPEIPPVEEPPPQITLADTAKIIEQIKLSGIQKLPLPLPLPPEVIVAIAKSKDVPATLQKLPEAQQEKIIAFIQQPAVFKYLKSIPNITLPTSVIPAKAGIYESSGGMDSRFRGNDAAAQPIDNSLLNIVKAQVSTKIAHETPQQEKTASPVISLLTRLLPFIAAPEKPADNASAPVRPFIPPQAVAQFQQMDATLQQSFFQFTVLKIFLPDTPHEKMPLMPAPSPMQPQPPQIGTVEAITPSGFPIIKTENNGTAEHYVFKAPVSVPIGSTVVFEAQVMTPDQVLMQTLPATPAPLGYTPDALSFNPLAKTAWPALQEALHTIAQVAQSAPAAAFKNTLPTATPKFTPSALFFLAALRIGSIESWLGANTLQALRDSGKRGLIEKLAGDFSRLSAQSKETISGDWRMISMPLLHDDQLSQMQFYIRRQHDDEKQDGQETKPVTRFILNLHLSRMGDMQLDGLLRKKQFDLILRSADPLPLNMRQDLMQSFTKGLEQANMQGGIGFQVRQDHWVNVEPPRHQGTLA